MFLWLVVGFLTWPKYVSVDVAVFRVSPVNLLLLGLLGWTAGRFLNPFTRDKSLGRDAYLVLFIFVAEWALKFVSDGMAPNPPYSAYLTLRDLMWTASIFVVAFQFGGGPLNIQRITWTVTLCGLFVASLGLIEYMTQTFVSTTLINGLHLNLPADYVGVLTRDKTRNGGFRIQSIYTHPLVTGEALAAMAPVMLSCIMTRRGARRAVAAVALAVCLLALFLTNSRASQVAVIIALAAYVCIAIAGSRSLPIRLFGIVGLPIAALIAVVTLYPVVAELQAGRNSVETQSSAARGDMWARGSPEIAKKPLLGHGDGQALELASIKIGNGFTVDDLYLTMLVDFGIVHLAVLGLLVVGCGAIVFRQTLPQQEHLAAVGLVAGLFGIAIGQKATSIFEGMGIFYLFCGLLAGLRRRVITPRRPLMRTTPSAAEPSVETATTRRRT